VDVHAVRCSKHQINVFNRERTFKVQCGERFILLERVCERLGAVIADFIVYDRPP